MFSLSEFLLMVLSGGGAALLACFALGKFQRPARTPPADVIQLTLGNTGVQRANRAALELFEVEEPSQISWIDIKSQLLPRFGDLPSELDELKAELATTGEEKVQYNANSLSDQAVLEVIEQADSIELRVVDVVDPTVVDRHRALSTLNEIARISSTLDKISEPLWTSTPAGELLWGNAAYQALDEPCVGNEESEAVENLFELSRGVVKLDQPPVRLSLTMGAVVPETHWYDVSAVKIDEARHLNIAVNVDKLIEAETAQRKFVQTLAKTFAQLSTGLAIFDRDRRLVLFNPALLDLTGLPAHFLSAQPNLQSFFNQLRSNRILPEPKNYASWRKQIADLVIESADGHYEEIWNLPDNQTFRVVGRPHPDGAIAFLFEDISVETSLTQKYRGQIALSNLALDSMEDAVVAFRANGKIALCNAAFRAFMNLPVQTQKEAYGLKQVSQYWDKKFEQANLHQLISVIQHSSQGVLKMRNGRELRYLAHSLDGYTKMLTLYTTGLAKPKSPSRENLSAAS